MSDRHAIPVPDLRVLAPDRGRMGAVLILAALMIGAAWLPDLPDLARRGLIAAGLSVIIVAGGMVVNRRMQERARTTARQLLAGIIERDAAPGVVTDGDGLVHARNAAARARFGATGGETLAALLRGLLANPSALLLRLQSRARIEGAAQEDVAIRGGRLRLAVHRLGENGFLWRMEELAQRAGAPGQAETLPIAALVVSRTGAILSMNDAARDLVGERARALDRLFADLPLRTGHFHRVETPGGRARVLVAQRPLPAGRREIFLMPADPAGAGNGAVFETLPVAMIKIDVSGKLLEINRLGAELLGSGATPGVGLEHVMTGLGRPVADWLRATFDDDGRQKSEFLRLTRPDREVFVQVTLSRASEQAEPVLIGVLNDATELKTLEAQFVQSQKMQAIGQLAGGVAHDFNNLLTAISGHCDLLLLRHDQGDQDFGDLVQINENANRAAALVGQLLAFSRKQTLRPEVLDLRDTLADLTHLLNRLVGEKVTLTLCHDPVLRPIRADKRQLEQVLMNLVVNARDAMPQGGEIRIETEVVTLDSPLTRDRATLPAGDYVTVKVVDAGTGIAPDKLQKVFEPFYTTKRTGEGTGLGLSTAYGIVKQTGGFIFVDSVPGHGSEFSLYFPAFEAPREGTPPPAREAARDVPARHGDGVVLLVEDEAPVRAFASRALRLRGYTVIEADSGEDALRVLADPALEVDVFVTDVVMPGMDGPTWVRRAMQDRPGVRVVFVSGYAEGAFGKAETGLPNSVFLPKPFSLNQLTDTVRQQMP
ncbi:MAG: response regulator [Rhodobacteraceae bacterium]|nr:response regulator [Paracoccaceae bacterium]